jgi:hypothetical protein
LIGLVMVGIVFSLIIRQKNGRVHGTMISMAPFASPFLASGEH